MFGSIVVGTDGSETASEAVRQATELAKPLSATVHVVSAYEPVRGSRLREERQQVPGDLQWMVNPREDVDATLERRGARQSSEPASRSRPTRARATRPTRSSTSPRSRAPT